MKIARYWAREEQTFPWGRGEGRAGCWGWSPDNLDDARQNSRDATKRLIEWLRSEDELPSRAGQYGYPDRPPREEIIKEFADENGQVAALLSRNSYGSLVLNTQSLAFADVDLPEKQMTAGDALAALKKLVGGLFGAKPPAASPEPSPEDVVLDRIRQWAQERPGYSLRVYRTAAGFRCMVTNREVAPGSTEARQFLEGLGSDLLYRRLCDTQECFRARLSPKPWRVGCSQPPNRFPWPDARAEQEYRAWQREYERQSESFATCRLVESHGADEVAETLAPLVRLHDELCDCGSEKPLA